MSTPDDERRSADALSLVEHERRMARFRLFATVVRKARTEGRDEYDAVAKVMTDREWALMERSRAAGARCSCLDVPAGRLDRACPLHGILIEQSGTEP